MNRRELILGALATLCAPLAVEAQQTAKRPRVGWLDFSSSAENLGIFVQAMSRRGWVEGRAFSMDYRGGEGRIERLSAVADELARLPVDVIVAPGTSEAVAAKKATSTIPIVMTGVDDPVERGLIGSLARPGGNITGLANAGGELNGKLLSLLRELIPGVASVAVLWDSTNPDQRATLEQLQSAAKLLRLSLNAVPVQKHTEVEAAFATIKRQANRALVVPPSSMLVPRWIADLALKIGLPLVSTGPAYAYEGGLMSYSDDWNALFDRVANFVDRILKGAKPAELPVELPAKFRLVVNAKTARLLGLSVPPSIMIRADSVIE